MLVDLIILFNSLNIKYTSLVSMKNEVSTQGEATIKSVMKKRNNEESVFLLVY